MVRFRVAYTYIMKNLKTNKINNNAKSYLAKLLATENISVEHKKVKTAYFDVKSRLLVLPIWKEMNEDITDLLIAHEVGHALFTPQSGWEDSIIKRKIPKSFLNVIEDARIEKLIKRKYPGLSQSFIKGYRDLINNNFFGTKDKDLDNMLLIDRLNIHFKSSHVESPITFTDTYESDVVSRMEKLETFEDVINLAEELAKYCKEEQEEKEQEMQMNGFDDHDFDDFDDEDMDDQDGDDTSDPSDDEEEEQENGSKESDSEGEEEEKDSEEQKDPINREEPSHGTQSEQEIKGEKAKPVAPPEEVSAETDQSWENKKENLLDPKSKNNDYINIHSYKNVNDYITDYKIVLKDFDRIFRKPYNKDTLDTSAQNAISKMLLKYRQFNKDQSKKVSYMVKEYEMKKAAAAYSRTKQDKSGIIDPLKLHSYKYNDDIFKRMAITPDGKNHGMMMFIDWSGSMSDKLTATIHQLMNLTMFCQKVNIPFEVYAFSNNTSYKSNMSRWELRDDASKDYECFPKLKYQEGDISIDNHLVLFNFISSKMSAKEYDEAMTNMYYLGVLHERYIYRSRRGYMQNDYDDQWKYDLHDAPRGYDLSSTPLNDTIMAAMKMVPAFQKSYNIDKMNTVFLTDGSSDGNDRVISFDLSSCDDYDKPRAEKRGYTYNYMSYDLNHILVDRITKRQINVGGRRGDLTEELLTALKLRTGTKVLGFFISGTKRLDRYALDKYFPEYNFDTSKKVKTFNRRKVMQDFRKNKCLVVNHNTGYDELYLLAGDNLKVEDGQMATPSENAKKGEIKRLFSATLKSNKSSRVILNKFVSQVA